MSTIATIGIDFGNVNINTSENIILSAKVKKTENLFESDYKVTIGKENFIIGEGEYETILDKTKKENFIPLLCGALALSTKENKINLVIGLPINQYKVNKDILEKRIKDNSLLNFKFNDKVRTIEIKNYMVYVEGVATYYSLDSCVRKSFEKRDIVILDIGGLTTDIALLKAGVKRNITKSSSITVGMLNIYNNFIAQLNSIYTLNLEVEEAENIIKNGLFVDGEKQDISFIKDILKENMDKVFKELNINYPIRTSVVLVTGGGGEALFKAIKKRFPNAQLVEDYLFSNARGYKNVGCKLWQKID